MDNKDNILVTTIIPCFNKQKYIKEAILSVDTQITNFNHEILVIDDCSTDNSYKVIKETASQCNHNIRIYKNSKNLGITKTWIKICNKANGKYIARLDGDDYWSDVNKLTKQVTLLEKSKQSKWCTTEFEIISETDENRHELAVQNKLVPFADKFEDMLIKKGFTNSSTWLVSKNLIIDINKKINLNTADDTFNIQLELLKSTKLSFLSDSTTVYRRLIHSDSTLNKERINKLLNTQLEYIDTTPNIDKNYMLKLSLKEYAKLQIANIEKDKLILEQNKIMQHRQNQIQDMKNSKTWKIGTIITKPLHKLFKA